MKTPVKFCRNLKIDLCIAKTTKIAICIFLAIWGASCGKNLKESNTRKPQDIESDPISRILGDSSLEEDNHPDDEVIATNQKLSMRLMTRLEYKNTLEAHFGNLSKSKLLESIGFLDNFPNENASLDSRAIKQHLSLIKELIKRDTKRTNPKFPCLTKWQKACNKSLELWASKIYGRPIAETEKQKIKNIFKRESKTTEEREAFKLTLLYLFSGPSMMYVQLNSQEKLQNRLDNHSIALKLSYALTGSPPDKHLLNLAREGKLANSKERTKAVIQLLKKNQSTNQILRFFEHWFQVGKVLSVQKSSVKWNSQLASSFFFEFRNYFLHYLAGKNPTISRLFLTEYTFYNKTLAEYYQIELPNRPDSLGFQKVLRDSKKYPGILSLGFFPTIFSSQIETSPIRRGAFIYGDLFCGKTPPPPEIFPLEEGDIQKRDKTMRERVELHTSSPACKGCHTKMDPPGFAMENLSELGFYRDNSNGLKLDISGSLLGTDQNQPFQTIEQFMQRLSSSRMVKKCFVQKWSQYLGIRFDNEESLNSYTEAILSAPGNQDGHILRTLIEMIASDEFLKI